MNNPTPTKTIDEITAMNIQAIVDDAMVRDPHLGAAGLLCAFCDGDIADGILEDWPGMELPKRDDVASAVATYRAGFPVETMTEAQYLAYPPEFRDVWTTEWADRTNWDQVRHRYMGKRTLLRSGGLEVEGITFRIVD